MAIRPHLKEFYLSFDRDNYIERFGETCDVPYRNTSIDFARSAVYQAVGLGLRNRYDHDYYDLSHTRVKEMYNSYFCIALNEMQRTVGNDIEISIVTLATDDNGETGLYSPETDSATVDTMVQLHTGKRLPAAITMFPRTNIGGEVLFSSEWWVDYQNHIDEILAFESARMEALRFVYARFAAAVAAAMPVYASRQRMKSAVFFQDWVGDALYRGALSGYDLVRGTGIQSYHHTMFAVPFEMQRATQAFPIGIRNATGMNFDSEMSWAHWDKRLLLEPWKRTKDSSNELLPTMWWTPEMLTPENARNFRDQADAAIQADAEGYVLCNWSIQDILDGTSKMDSTRAAAWTRIVGTGDDEHLHGPGGIVSSGPNDIRKRIALYISDPVAMLTQLSDTWMEMLYGTGSWYEPLGGIFGKMFKQCQDDCDVAVVNDAMILDTEGAILDLYDEIWVAYPNENLHYFALRDTCIARTEQSAAYQYLLARPDKVPIYPFPIELYPATF